MARASKLIKDLQSVPGIVGALGLSIAAAQKALNLDYLDNIERLLALMRILLPSDLPETARPKAEEMKALFEQMLRACAPPRYQYTETTLAVKLDLAQSMDANLALGFGIGTGALVVNAALSIGYSYDYRAAAECRTVIHAIPADPQFMEKLLARADKLSDKALNLPERSELDAQIVEQARTVFEKVMEVKKQDGTPLPAKDTVPAASKGGLPKTPEA